MKLYSYLREQKNLALRPVVVLSGVFVPLKLSLEESQKLKDSWLQASKEVHQIVRKRRYRKFHLAELNQTMRSWRQNNPGKVKEYCHARRARKKFALGRFIGKEWTVVCEKYQHYCVACLRTNLPLVADHVISLAAGGSNHISNIQPLCGPCNSRKGVQCTDYREAFLARLAMKMSHDSCDSYDSSQKVAVMGLSY